MSYRFSARRGALARACSPLALALSLAAAPALAQTAAPENLDLGAVLAKGTGSTAALQNTPGTASYEAPSVAPLNSSQPTSVVTKHTIDNQMIGTQSFVDVAELTPSVSAISPNGPGLQEANGPVLRGFQDGQFNVTYDGIPIGDSNDFTHHSTSFFTGDETGQEIVDRGPGTAETVGDATFGGTMSVRTIDPTAQRSATANGEWGSWGTNLGGLTLNTGSIATANGTTAVFNAEHIASNGGVSNTPQERSNFFGKVVIPVNNSTTVTLLTDYNKLYQSFTVGATSQEIAQYGSSFGNSADPNSQSNGRYNADKITTDMEYADVQSNLGDGFLYDGKLYTYAYYHRGLNGTDPNDDLSGATPNLVQFTPSGTEVTGVPGQAMENEYRSIGTIQRIQKNLSFGDVKAGIWYDHQVDTRMLREVILNAGSVANYDANEVGSATATNNYGQIDRLQHNQLYTIQPYAQFDWKPIDGLTATVGVKDAVFRRALNATVNQKTGLQQGYNHTWSKVLPSIEVKYSINPNLSVYGQAAQGFLAPNLNTFYIKNLSTTSFKPEDTINFQAGAAYQSQHIALSGDVYTIHFENYVSAAGSGANKHFVNDGGVIYRGVEGEAAYTFDLGLTAFANAGYNQAYQTAGNVYVTSAPQGTANLGLIYDKDGIYGSVIDHWTGGEYSGNNGIGTYGNSAAGGKSPGGWYNPYNTVNLAGAYTFNHTDPNKVPVKVKLNLDNVTNQTQVIYDDGTNAAGQLWYYTLPGVSAFVSVSVPVNF